MNQFVKSAMKGLINEIIAIKQLLKNTDMFFDCSDGFVQSFLITELKKTLNEYYKLKQIYLDNIIDCKDVILAGDVVIEY